ncbi:MAG: hypothetical protein ACOC2U_00545 [bacterium]
MINKQRKAKLIQEMRSFLSEEANIVEESSAPVIEEQLKSLDLEKLYKEMLNNLSALNKFIEDTSKYEKIKDDELNDNMYWDSFLISFSKIKKTLDEFTKEMSDAIYEVENLKDERS